MAYFECTTGIGAGGGATITVTYNSSFYNKTMTCSNGTKTYTKTTTSSGSTEFKVSDEGTWTITCNGVSRTVLVTLNYSTQMAVTKTVTVYGAAGATISFTDAVGSKTVTLDNSGQGSVSITFIPPSQSITFTDTNKAKNPNNLSQNYSKAITITDSTTEVAIMPVERSKIVYWYGYNDSNIVGINSKGFKMHTYTYVGNVSHNQNTVTDTGVTSQGNMYAGFASDTAYDVTDFSDMKVVANTQVGINNVYYSRTGVNVLNTNIYEDPPYQIKPKWTTSPMLATLDLSSASVSNVYFYLGLMYEATKTETLYAVWFE